MPGSGISSLESMDCDLTPNFLTLSSKDGTSRVTGDGHARICDSLGVRFPGLLGDGKRGDAFASVLAPILDSTEEKLIANGL